MAEIGTIYVLANPAIPGLVKVGKTTRSVDARIKELSSATGVPNQFMLIYEQTFLDVDNAESQIHVILESRGYRHAANREFFNGKPSDVIKIINTIKGKIDDLYNPIIAHETDECHSFNLGEFGSNELTAAKNQKFFENYQWFEIWSEAENYHYGLNGYMQDYSDAIELYSKACKLGCPFAFQKLGDICLSSEGMTSSDKGKALEYYKQGVKLGDYYCYLKMGILYCEVGSLENTRKCLDRFIEKSTSKDIVIEFGNVFASSLATFLQETFKNHPFTIEQKNFIRGNRTDILSSIKSGMEYADANGGVYDFSKINRLCEFINAI